jgi:hypothetical protein
LSKREKERQENERYEREEIGRKKREVEEKWKVIEVKGADLMVREMKLSNG